MGEVELGEVDLVVLGVLAAGEGMPDGPGVTVPRLNGSLPVSQQMPLSALGGVLVGLHRRGVVVRSRGFLEGGSRGSRRYRLTVVGLDVLQASAPPAEVVRS